jgi:hypothetical protein
MFTRFDLTVLVAEPTGKGVGVCRQWTQYAAGYDVAITTVGNKVQSQQDVAYLREHAGDDLLTWLGHEPAVRAMEQGRPLSLADLAPDTLTALARVQAPSAGTGRLHRVHQPAGPDPQPAPGAGGLLTRLGSKGSAANDGQLAYLSQAGSVPVRYRPLFLIRWARSARPATVGVPDQSVMRVVLTSLQL